ncbi:MAG: hydroxymethylpyrimidine/phosphomethylpyrimidine kinase [Ginsengibacter sp.]
MDKFRPIILCIAGIDPCAGAGLLADIKTAEQHHVYALGVSTALTLQTESEFISIKWEQESDIINSMQKMLMHYDVSAVKVGIVNGAATLLNIIIALNNIKPGIKIIVDPVISSSTGFNFWSSTNDFETLKEIMHHIYLLTPNFDEMKILSSGEDAMQHAISLSHFGNILLKGGHHPQLKGTDHLIIKGEVLAIESASNYSFEKHGSGCVLSTAIASNIAKGQDLINSCTNAKRYIESFLSSNETHLGYHA